MDTLASSIESVLCQTLKPDRFLIIDNASTDDSREIAIQKGVEVINADNRYKFITGLNTAIALNRDLLFFMQNDVTLDKECLKSMMSCAGVSRNFMCQPVIYQKNGEIDNAGMDIYWPGFGLRRAKKWWSGSSFLKCGLVTTICFMTDSRKHRYCEEFSPAYYEDLSFKLEYPDMSHYLVPSARATHNGNHTFSQTLSKFEISEICRKNRKKFIKKHYFGFDRWIRLAVSSCLDIMKKTFDIIRERRVFFNNRK